jgi:integrase
LHRTGEPIPWLWIHYTVNGKTTREPTRTTNVVKARKLRAKRMEQHGRGEPGRSAEKVLVGELLDALTTNYEVNGRASLRTLKGHLAALRPAFGQVRAIDVTTDLLEARQLLWQRSGTSNATVNRRCNTLRRAFNLARRARKVHVVPYIPRLEEQSPRGRYIAPADFAALVERLPAYLHPFADFAYRHGIRKGQLARTQRRFVDLQRGVVAWPPAECKHREPHVAPLADDALALVRGLMQAPPLWCPYLFHGPHCAPGRVASRTYGCVGDFKKSWASACKAAGFPVGRKAGGYVFHHTRNTAATNMRAGGMEEADAMKVTGHTTAHVFRHYDIGNVEALRQQMQRACDYVDALPKAPSVTPLRAQR